MAAVGDPASDPDSRVCAADDCDVMFCCESVDVTEALARRDLQRSGTAVCGDSWVAGVELEASDPVCVDGEGVGAGGSRTTSNRALGGPSMRRVYILTC